jgi:hypothetical protein
LSSAAIAPAVITPMIVKMSDRRNSIRSGGDYDQVVAALNASDPHWE